MLGLNSRSLQTASNRSWIWHLKLPADPLDEGRYTGEFPSGNMCSFITSLQPLILCLLSAAAPSTDWLSVTKHLNSRWVWLLCLRWCNKDVPFHWQNQEPSLFHTFSLKLCFPSSGWCSKKIRVYNFWNLSASFNDDIALHKNPMLNVNEDIPSCYSSWVVLLWVSSCCKINCSYYLHDAFIHLQQVSIFYWTVNNIL